MYHQKYQKYKLKYLDLKYRFSQHGGTVITNFNQIEDGMTSIIYNGVQTLEARLLPNSLKSITFGKNFNNGDKPLTHNLFPNNSSTLFKLLTSKN